MAIILSAFSSGSWVLLAGGLALRESSDLHKIVPTLSGQGLVPLFRLVVTFVVFSFHFRRSGSKMERGVEFRHVISWKFGRKLRIECISSTLPVRTLLHVYGIQREVKKLYKVRRWSCLEAWHFENRVSCKKWYWFFVRGQGLVPLFRLIVTFLVFTCYAVMQKIRSKFL